MNKQRSKIWLQSRIFDFIFILSPPFVSVLFVLIFSHSLEAIDRMPLWAWVIFVLCIDVSHVYSTLFRTYFNTKEFSENKTLFTVIPILVFLVGVILYTVGAHIFWRVLAYFAVYHFIRQQYGFMRLYSRNSIDPKIKSTQTFQSITTTENKELHEPNKSESVSKIIDALTIYTATLYPIVYWHVNLPRNFRWFTDGDFFSGVPQIFERIFLLIYIAIVIVYLIKETKETIARHSFNLPKNLILFGTAISWYVGIVLLNGDIIFTITNVITHGIPYIALVWIFGKRQADNDSNALVLNRLNYKIFFSKFSFPIFILTLIFIGYMEEGLWAGLVWREHLEVFSIFAKLPVIHEKDTLSWLVPLLTLPQATHYVLDGFIWKLKNSDSHWYKIFFK